MGALFAVLEGIALNPSIESSIGNLVAGIATHMIANSGQPDAIKQMGMELLGNSGKIIQAVLTSTPSALAKPAA